jgi:SAM-dependent methyltransferase
MADTLPPRPAPIPPPDRHQIERLNAIYDLSSGDAQQGWLGRLAGRMHRITARLLGRQRAFNAVLVDHINRNALVGVEAHHASTRIVDWVEQAVQTALDRFESQVDETRRHQEALAAWERRMASLASAHEELRTSIAVVQQAVQHLKREVARLAESGVTVTAGSGSAPHASAAPATQLESLDSHKYVGFEDQFRGSPDEIRRRVADYVPIFDGMQEVIDVGCGRGEFLTLLRDAGIRARGVDVNGAMVEVCRRQGLDAEEADALTFLKRQPDGSVGGLFAAQVIEHLEPRYLGALLDTAFDKLRPGAPIVLETINPACWFAFFESYIRDLTHVQPVHPETLKFLLVATGFQRVDIRYRSPYPEHEKLLPLAPHAALGDAVATLNANVERINGLLFTWLDYAAIGRRP